MRTTDSPHSTQQYNPKTNAQELMSFYKKPVQHHLIIQTVDKNLRLKTPNCDRVRANCQAVTWEARSSNQ